MLCAVCPWYSGVGMFREGVGVCRRGVSTCMPISLLLDSASQTWTGIDGPQYGTKALLRGLFKLQDSPADGACEGKHCVFWFL